MPGLNYHYNEMAGLIIQLQVRKDNQSSIFIAQSTLKEMQRKHTLVYIQRLQQLTRLYNPAEVAAGGQDKIGKM